MTGLRLITDLKPFQMMLGHRLAGEIRIIAHPGYVKAEVEDWADRAVRPRLTPGATLTVEYQ